MKDQLGLLEAALGNTTRVISGIGDDQWQQATPCPKWNVEQLVQHTVGVMNNFALGAAGQPVGDPMDHDMGGDASAACAAAAQACVSSWDGRGELESTVTLGDNEFPGMVGLMINALDSYVHGWDVAQATGQDASLDPEISAALLGFAQQAVPTSPREGDRFGPVVATGDDASTQDQLLAYLGRTP